MSVCPSVCVFVCILCVRVSVSLFVSVCPSVCVFVCTNKDTDTRTHKIQTKTLTLRHKRYKQRHRHSTHRHKQRHLHSDTNKDTDTRTHTKTPTQQKPSGILSIRHQTCYFCEFVAKTHDTSSCRPFPAKEPLIIGFCGTWPVKIRHPMGLRHPVYGVWTSRLFVS